MATLKLEGLTKHFGAHVALDAIDLAVDAQEFLAVVGPSGCGKTTLLRAIAGLDTPTSGQVTIDGKVVTDTPPRLRDVGMVFQGDSLYPHLTARENIAFPLRVRGTAKADVTEKVTHAAARVGASELLKRYPGTLSGGERQRVALARALVRDPKILLLDEPFAHLDLPLRRQLGAELMAMRASLQATTLFVTHDPKEACALGDRVAVMQGGRIDACDTPGAMRDHAFLREALPG